LRNLKSLIKFTLPNQYLIDCRDTEQIEQALTVMADRIYMLEQGNIIEQGNHKELMAVDGKYAQMFRMQAEKYNISE
jgi:ABC-type cobalamin transport system ATPase subunit